MITQEMVKEATVAGIAFLAKGKESEVRKEIEDGEPVRDFLEMFEAGLTKAYPLIRQQVLEEAAKEAETDMVLLPIHPEETKNAYGKRVIATIAQAIRNLKDKTDEAHNG